MIEIKKGKEPKELLRYRKQEYASYSDMPSDLKRKVIQSLLSEQGHLCAYCMSRIDENDGKHRVTIEHCIPQAETSEDERLNYKNMLAVCWGNRDAHSNDDKSCDARRGCLKGTQQDMKAVNVFDGRTLKDIRYSANGTIFSNDPNVEEDLTLRLNLNCEARQLRRSRLNALHTVQKKINEKYPDKTAPKSYFRHLLEHYSEPSEKRVPYVGIIIDWLSGKV